MLHARVDSFVLETDVHYPTDTNLLYDAVRKAIETAAGLSNDAGLSDWRQSQYNIRQFKKAHRHVQRLRHSTSRDEDKRKARQEEIDAAYEAYLAQAEIFLARLRNTRIALRIGCALPEAALAELDGYVVHAERQIDQRPRTRARVRDHRHRCRGRSSHTMNFSKGVSGRGNNRRGDGGTGRSRTLSAQAAERSRY